MADSDYGDLAHPNKVRGSDARNTSTLHEFLRLHASAKSNIEQRLTLVESALRNVKEYCEEMFSPEWLADPRNRDIFAHRVYAMVRVVVLAGEPPDPV